MRRLLTATLIWGYPIYGLRIHLIRWVTQASTKHQTKGIGWRSWEDRWQLIQPGDYPNWGWRSHTSQWVSQASSRDQLKGIGWRSWNIAHSYHYLGLPNLCLEITNQPPSHKSELWTSDKKVLDEDHENTAHSYHELGITQCTHRDYTSASESHKRALNIRQRVLGEDYEKTADSHHNLGVT